jgi:secondary thiamine-phosphate synthase enzyme
MHKIISITTRGQGLYDITAELNLAISELHCKNGLCTIFVKHTSCSLTIQENADPSARHDLENWLSRLVPENDSLYTHTAEGPDDMPAHIKSILTQTSISIPIIDGELVLGVWQGFYLWEHRHANQQRELVIFIS